VADALKHAPPNVAQKLHKHVQKIHRSLEGLRVRAQDLSQKNVEMKKEASEKQSLLNRILDLSKQNELFAWREIHDISASDEQGKRLVTQACELHERCCMGLEDASTNRWMVQDAEDSLAAVIEENMNTQRSFFLEEQKLTEMLQRVEELGVMQAAAEKMAVENRLMYQQMMAIKRSQPQRWV